MAWRRAGRAAHDPFVRKRGKYPARSVFKLQEVQDRFGFLCRGDHVLDLGCGAGSWAMYAGEVVGEQGRVLGLDLQPGRVDPIESPNVVLRKQDVMKWRPPPSLYERFDACISDMMANTTGQRELDSLASAELCGRALELSDRLVRPGGSLLVKVFQGRHFEPLLEEFRDAYEEVRVVKPKSSRSESVEVFVLSLGRRVTPSR